MKKIGIAIATAVGFLLTSAATGRALADDKTAQDTTQPAEKHHSKAKGAVVGGALVQHHKNKKALKKQQKAQKEQKAQ